MEKKAVLIFGVGSLQKSLILKCKRYGLYTIGIDPSPNATCRHNVDSFEVVDGDDFQKTLEVARKYNISGLITTATDKPLLMMARVAEKLNLPFFSSQCAIISTDKHLMKQTFREANVPCPKSSLISCPNDLIELDYPIILKPRDNSGSRGVIKCNTYLEALKNIEEVKLYTKHTSILAEEYIEGKEFSVEALHYNGLNNVIQITEKITTPPPYNVEIGHNQPANLSSEIESEIKAIIDKISSSFSYISCASHTEFRINSLGQIKVIETSPRLGGDYITSHLVTLSTAVDMEQLLIDISLGNPIEYKKTVRRYSGVRFFYFPAKKLITLETVEKIRKLHKLVSHLQLDLKIGSYTPLVTNSIDRYGGYIIEADTMERFNSLDKTVNEELYD